MGKKSTVSQMMLEIARVQVEGELRTGELRYRQLFNEMVDGFALHEIISDEKGTPVDYRFLEINPAFEKLTGLKAEDLLGRTVLEALPDIEPSWIEKYGQVALTGESISFENFSQDLDKYYSVKAFSPERGKFATIFSDITEIKRSHQMIELRMRLLEFASTHPLHELLQKTLDEVGELTKSPIGFYHFVEADQETISLQAWSTQTITDFCTARGDGLHYPVSKAGVWADCIRLRQPIIHNDYSALLESKGLPEGHAEVIRELVVPIFRDERIVAILGIGNKTQDYTDEDVKVVTYLADVAWELVERKHAENQIQESEAKYRSLFENVPDGVYRTTPTGEFLAVNPAFLQIFGYKTVDEIKKINAFELYVDKADREAFIKQLRETGEVHNLEIEAKRKDGRVFYGLDNCRAIYDQQGEILYYEGTLTDITERKEANKKLDLHRKELERLYRASSSLLLSKSTDLLSLSQTIVETVVDEFDHANCSLLLVQKNSTTLQRVAISGDYKEQVSTKVLSLDGSGLVPEAIRTGKIINAPDVLSEKNYIPNWDKARSELVISLKVDNQIIGAIDIQSTEPNAFSADDERLMTVFAQRAAMALERVRL